MAISVVKKYLAYIWPNEDITNKNECSCSVLFASGDREQELKIYMIPTNVFQYYYWGVTFEVVELDENDEVADVHDIMAEDLKYFKLDLSYVVTYDCLTHRAICSDNVVYDLGNNVFRNRCRLVSDYILSEINTAENFVAYLYTNLKGVVYILFDKNLTEDHKQYKYAVHRGFVTRNEKILRSLTPTISIKTSDGKLTQKEIDALMEEMGIR